MDKPKRKASVWIKALKEYNKDKTVWALPKKGGPEYKEVSEIVSKIKKNDNLDSIRPDLRKLQNLKPVKSQPAPDLRKLQNLKK
jgi:hypothetical protein